MKNEIRNGMMLLAVVLFLATSCDQINPSDGGGKGTVVLSLTDAPFPVSLVESAMITIDKIEIRSKTDDIKDKEKEGDDIPSRYIVLYEGAEKQFDLLDLQNGVTAELASMDIPSGTYDLLKMHVTKSSIVLKNGTKFDLTIPSGTANGMKIRMTPELVVEDGVASEVILDFDVSKSFVVHGNIKAKNGIKGFIFKPLIRAVCQKHSGIIRGKVFENTTTPIPEAHVQVINADTILSSALTDAEGNYQLIGIPVGNYKMICEKEGYATKTIDQVKVKAREKTIQHIQMTK